MSGSLAQLIALVTYGNAFFIGNSELGKLSADNSTFKYCSAVIFKNTDSIVVAKQPADWFHYLQENGCLHLRLFYKPSSKDEGNEDYKTAGFIGGGGVWWIEAVYKDHAEFWMDDWQSIAAEAADSFIWSVTYNQVGTKKITNYEVSMAQATEHLQITLYDIKIFARNNNQNYWADEHFEKAEQSLTDNNPGVNFYYPDMVPGGYLSLQARQLLFAAGYSFVFGGMGSWNDIVFDSPEDESYCERVSQQLYTDAIMAIMAATMPPTK